MSQENNGALAGGCCHVRSACYHIAVVQVILGECLQTSVDSGGIIQNVVRATAFKGSRGNVDCSKIAGIQPCKTIDEPIDGVGL